MKAERTVAWLGFVLGSLTLLSQLTILLSAYVEDGRGWGLGFAHYLGYLTILSNTGLVLVYAGALFRANWLEVFRHPRTKGSAAAVITLVMIFYAVFLAPITPAAGLTLVNAYIFHYVLPVLYLAWWTLFAAHGKLEFRDIPVMVTPGVVYAIYVLVRGPILGEYPYPMIDVLEHGYPYVLVFMLAVTVGLSILSALVVLADRLLTRRGAVAND